MTALLFWLFVVLLALPLFKVFSQPAKIYEFPYFMAATFAIFVLPQAVSLIRFPGAAPEEAVQNVLLVTCLCLAACLLGYRIPFNPIPAYRVTQAVDEARLFHVGLVFVGCGIGFTYLLSHIEVQTSEVGGWTGPATIYGFFQQLCYPGFAICLMVALRRPALVSFGATLVSALVPVQSMLFGRREPAALFLLTIGLTLYYRRRLRPPRWLVMTTIFAVMLAIPATATYRRFQLQNDWEGIRQIQLVGNFRDFLGQESVLELRNAAMLIEAARRSGNYEYGAGYWNHLVFRYVPAQILGDALKASLMIQRSSDDLERELAGMDYTNPTGSTVTAMGDSFQQFGYWGCLFFVVVGEFFRRLWRASTPQTALFAQLLYMQSCTSAMRAVTHWTLDFLPGLLYNLIFLGAAMLYSGDKQVARGEGRGHGRGRAGRAHSHLPSALATIKIRLAPPGPPPGTNK
jgi:hypothetical protein